MHTFDSATISREAADRIEASMGQNLYKSGLENLREYRQIIQRAARESSRRQRALLYSHLRINKGLSRSDARKLLKESLYNWDSAASVHERAIFGELALFYVFTKNAFAQVHRALFEGMDMGLDEYMSKWVRGRTKVQRLELMTRLSSYGAVGPTPGGIEEVVSPQEARERALAQEQPDYLSEYPLFGYGTFQRDVVKEALHTQGLPYSNWATVGAKITPVEYLNHYAKLVNLTIAPTIVAALGAIGLTDQRVNTDAVLEGLVDYAAALSNPLVGEATRQAAEWAGVVPERRGSEFGRRLRANEITFLTAFGLQDAIKEDHRTPGLLRINPDPDSGIFPWLVGTGGGSFIEGLLLTEYVRFRNFEEVATLGTRPLSRGAALFLYGLAGYQGEELDRVVAQATKAPLPTEVARIQSGNWKGIWEALANLTGLYKTYFYSGKDNKEFDIKDQLEMANDMKLKLRRLSDVVEGTPSP